MKEVINRLESTGDGRRATHHTARLAEIESSRWTPVEALLQALQQLRRMIHELCPIFGAADEDEGVIDQLRRLVQLQPGLHCLGVIIIIVCRMHLN